MSLSTSPAPLIAGVAAADGEAVAAAVLPGAGLDDPGMAVGAALEVGGAGDGLAAVATGAGRDAGGAAGVEVMTGGEGREDTADEAVGDGDALPAAAAGGARVEARVAARRPTRSTSAQPGIRATAVSDGG